MDPNTITSFLEVMTGKYKFSAENFIFGMGGGLLQKVNRDTQRLERSSF
jgi:nicotinic acid phosphoribosyltransferase